MAWELGSSKKVSPVGKEREGTPRRAGAIAVECCHPWRVEGRIVTGFGPPSLPIHSIAVL